jgi:acyl-CoA synthetase (AMP-forming)/AMP-acid ligase II
VPVFATVEPSPEIGHRYRAEGWWDGRTLPELLSETLSRNSHRSLSVYTRTTQRKLRLADVAELGRRLAGGLIARGIRVGDPVAFQLPNSVEAATVFFGLIHLGAVLVPLSHALGRTEVIYAVRLCGARAVIIDGHSAVAADVDELLSHETESVVLVGESSRSTNVISLDAVTDAAPGQAARHVDPAEPAVIGWTSGSTAAPKGVLLSHRALCAEVRVHMAPMFAGAPRPLLSTSPVSHVTGMLISLLVPPLIGRDIHLMDYWDSGDALELMVRHRLSAGSGAPIFLQTLLDHPHCEPRHHQLIAQAALGGASVSPELIRRADRVGIAATRGYGCTEHPSISLGRSHDGVSLRAATDGVICTGVDVLIADDDGNDCTAGTPGEILTRGPDLFSGYLDPTMNAEAFHHGWYRTGDVGVVDDHGHLTVVDRKKDIIIRAGLNISAAEVEAVLTGMPAIAEVALVAAPNERTGEHGCAFIRPAQGYHVPGLTEIRETLATAGIAKYKWPEEVRVQIADFPRTPAGKIRKVDLRRFAAQPAVRTPES